MRPPDQRVTLLEVYFPNSLYVPMEHEDRTTITVSKATRTKVRACKRAGESYDELLSKMADQYEPDAIEDNAPAATGAN